MGFLERVSGWLEPPSYVMYRCSNCSTVIEDAPSLCPDCGGELTPDPIPLDTWERM